MANFYLTAATSDTATMLATFIPLILMFVVFYFILIRPQKKREKEVQKMREAYYYFIHFESETTTPGEIEERIRIMDGVIRYLCVKQEA